MLSSFSARVLSTPDEDQIELVQTWRDVGTARWLVAVAALGTWLVLFGLSAWKVKPRRVRPGPDALDLVGDEPPAVVNLITNSWSLEHEAIPATLLDLAARGHVSIRQAGQDAVVYVPLEPPARAASDPLLRYERMVLKHVKRLARRTSDGVVPAGALTTGPDEQAKRWWRRFRLAVHDDARDRGLAERRWSRWTKVGLILLAVAAAAPLGFALSAAVYDAGNDTDLVSGGVTYSVVVFVALAVLSATRSGVADTPQGREVAARWLGLRAMLSTDPLFAEHHPSGVDVWGRKLAYGAAMGLAHGAVHALPLGAENDREVWSHVSGSWRVVHVHYPRWLSIGYGNHPLLSVLQGLLVVAMGAMPVLVVSQITGDELGASPFFAVTAVPFGLMAVAGLWAVWRGLADLVTPKQTVEGSVVRWRAKASGKSERWYVVVDDGKSSHVSAWKFDQTPNFGLDAVVRARVSRRLRYVSQLEVLDASATVVPPEEERSVQVLDGTQGRPEIAIAEQLAARTDDGLSSDGVHWPDAAAISERIGRPVQVDETVSSHPMARDGQSVAYRDGEGLIHAVRINREVFTRFRRPRFLNRPVPEVGDEAFRLRVGGALLARRGDEAVMVAVHLPGEPTVERDRISKTVARQCLEGARRAAVPRVEPTAEPASPGT